MSIVNFKFDEMTLKLANIPESTVKKKLDTTARIFGIEHKENYISNWLAFLIDPERFGSEAPLNALLSLYFSKLKLKGEEYEEDYVVTENELVEVSREEALGQAQRIDFLITTDKLLIGIESKIYAALHINQLKKYGQSIVGNAEKSEEKKIPVLILLTPKWSREIPYDDFIHITFEELAEAFRKLHFDYLNNLRSAFLLEDFVNYVEEYLKGGESSMNEEWARFIGTNTQELQKIVEEGQKNLNAFKNDLIECLNTVFDDEEWEHKIGKSTQNQFWFQLNHTRWDEFDIHYEVGRLDEESTQGFILPNKLKLTIDVESKESRQYFQNNKPLPFKKVKDQYLIEVIDINYTNKESVVESFKLIESVFRNWHRDYGAVVDKAIESMKNEVL
ncbi:PD-(D/E)XK nuclease family protein [Salinicoccus hispanicus]|uniref:PD-(D/E)XK nuclease family protein n=1 Tax=Salinicoccus hispanicus TaxID=157225 RepID=A0A6N8U4Y1_9STAP|nr:PD-(D/E)XK nuclease family protein [Salinicoccus hispanicus]MXQ51341.1 hypothetical protein [Salinicoccus hispanicus]